MAVVVMGLCVLFGLVKINLKGKPKKPLLLMALFCPCIYFVGETMGISQTTASESGVFLACIPVVSLAASALILKKKPAEIQIVGILITLPDVLITVLAVLYQGIGCSIAAFFPSNVAIARIGVNLTSSFIGVATVVSVIAGGASAERSFFRVSDYRRSCDYHRNIYGERRKSRADGFGKITKTAERATKESRCFSRRFYVAFI